MVLRTDHRFDLFIVDDSNRDAREAACALAQNRASGRTLHIVGPTNSGKTHLLHAVGNWVRTHQDTQTVGVAPGREVGLAIAGRSGADPPLEALLEVDVLLVDNPEYLCNRPATRRVFWDVVRQREEQEARTVTAWLAGLKTRSSLDDPRELGRVVSVGIEPVRNGMLGSGW